ncbi:MAG: hypothetical protein K2P79_10600 [Sphingomonas sp.]|nr:hypothetical protein [Sphingomonas sp.]
MRSREHAQFLNRQQARVKIADRDHLALDFDVCCMEGDCREAVTLRLGQVRVVAEQSRHLANLHQSGKR